jgi:hypothetical protein
MHCSDTCVHIKQYDCACNHLTHASTLHLLLLLLQLHYYHSIGAAKRDAEELLKTLLSDTSNGLNSTTEAMSTDAIETAFDGISIAVKGLFEERVESITTSYEGAATIADSAFAELVTLLFTRLDSVQTKHALLREKLDSTVAAAQGDSVVEFLAGVDAIALPLPSSELDAKLKTLLDATTEKLSKTVLALVSSVTLQQELPSFKTAVSAQAFAKLEAVTRAIVQHRRANGTHAELKQQQEAKAAADWAATQAKAAAAKAVADAAQAEAAATQIQNDLAEQLEDYKRRPAQRQQQPQQHSQYAAAENESAGGYSEYEDCYGANVASNRNSGGSHCSSSGLSGGERRSSSSASGPLNQDGTPNMKYKSNWLKNSEGQYINKDGSLKMSIASNRAYVAQQRSYADSDYSSNSSPGPLRRDGQPDMRYTVNRQAAQQQSSYGGSSYGGSGGGSTRASGPLKQDGTPDMRYKANRRSG